MFAPQEQPQTPDEIATAWQSLPALVRDSDEAKIVGEHLAIIVMSSHHMCAACFVPRPPGALL